MHPELTGRENIYMNGTVLGMKKGEIDTKFDKIVDFSGISKFIDTPVKRYSSGMRVRLGFAIAAHLDPEILVVDEVLAVGDAEFQSRCIGRMSEVASSGRTVLFVSHNMGVVESLCTRVLVLEKGYVGYDGNVLEAVDKYMRSTEKVQTERQALSLKYVSNRDGFLRNVWVEAGGKRRVSTVKTGASATFAVAFSIAKPMSRVSVHIALYAADGSLLAHLDSYPYGNLDLDAGDHTIRCTVSPLMLNRGHYRINVALMNANLRVDHASHVSSFSVEGIEDSCIPVVPPRGSVVFHQSW
jgi:lipopolysaccharide transport system ATP-binding protein